jgi:filamentous hemagglutinin family protein
MLTIVKGDLMDKRTGMVQSEWLLMAMVGLLPLLWVPVSLGQTTSITSSGLNTHVSHTAGQQNYDITGGTRPGNGTNLFHSFGDLSVGTSDVARFLNDSGLATTNILSRVTGGNPSNIFGTIQTIGFGNANLFLMNPAGIVFGPHASLNVGGSVAFTTADYLKLADGVGFKALGSASADGLLSAAPVAAFGFLNAHPRPITVQGSQLSVPDGKGLSLVGGDVQITRGTLTASGGQINLASLAGRGEARVSPENIAISGRTHRGHIEITGGSQPDEVARLNTSGDQGGAVVIRGGKLSLVRAEVTTEAQADNHTGGAIILEATKSTTFDTVGLRTGGSNLDLSDPRTGVGGAVSLTAPTVRASHLTIDTSAHHSSLAGDVAIKVRTLSASNLNLLNSGSHSPASGNISIQASGPVTLRNSGIGSNEDFNSGGQNPGHITVRAATLTLERTRMSSFSVLRSAADAGAGDIVIDVGRLTMHRSFISTETEPLVGSTKQAGNIRVSAREAILIDGAGGGAGISTFGDSPGSSITLSTPHLTLNQGSVRTGSEGERAGDISVNVRTLNMFNGGGISTRNVINGSTGNIDIVASHSINMAGVGMNSIGDQVPTEIRSETATTSPAGHVHIVTPTLRLADRAVVRAFSQSDSNAGSIVVDVGRLNISRGARIQSSNPGVAGTPIVINAAKSITLDKGTITTANTSSVEQSGDVSLFAGKSIELRNGSLISADLTDDGDAGHIAIHAGRSVVIRDSTVSAKAERGNGGTIDVDARKVTLTNSQLTTSVSGGPQTVAGEISVDAKSLTLRNSQILSTATEGDGGTIHIRSRAFHKDAKSVIDASSESGTDGTVTIESRH